MTTCLRRRSVRHSDIAGEPALWGTSVVAAPFATLAVLRLTEAVDTVLAAFLTHVVVGVWLAANAVLRPRLRHGALLLLVGGTANLIAIWANGAMPVRRTHLPGDPSTLDHRHVLASPSTRFSLLGDWIDLSFMQMMASPGDALMLAGLLVLAFGQLTGSRRICIESATARSLRA